MFEKPQGILWKGVISHGERGILRNENGGQVALSLNKPKLDNLAGDI